MLYVLAAMLLCSADALAQEVPEPSTYLGSRTSELAGQWLKSPDPRLEAWGAHAIVVNGLSDLGSALKAQLEHTTAIKPLASNRIGHFRATVAMLDALIALKLAVPAAVVDQVEALGYGTGVEELALLSRLPWEEGGASIRRFYQPTSGENYAATRVAAQMLVERPPKGFAAEVLSSVVVRAQILVHAPGAANGIGVGSGSCCGAGFGLPPVDWPEIGRYSFQDPPPEGEEAQKNETLFLKGRDPIYLLRTVSKTYAAWGCGGLSPLNDALRSHLVGTLLGGTPASPFAEGPVFLDIPFVSREDYRGKIQGFVDGQEENFREVGLALARRDLLTEEERQGLALRVDLSVQDTRQKPAEDLPGISFRLPVRWVGAEAQ